MLHCGNFSIGPFSFSRSFEALRPVAVGKLQDSAKGGGQWKQGVVVIYTMLHASLLHNTTPIHCAPLPLHPPVMNTRLDISHHGFRV